MSKSKKCGEQCKRQDFEEPEEDQDGPMLEILWSKDGQVFISAEQVLGLLEDIAEHCEEEDGEGNNATQALNEAIAILAEETTRSMQSMIDNLRESAEQFRTALEQDLDLN